VSCELTDTGLFRAWSSKVMAANVPLHALFEITERCNYACGHCYLPHRGDAELSTGEALGVLDALADAGTLFLTLTGGEVFLRRDFLEIARHAADREFALRIFTNGWFVDGPHADSLAALAPMAVEISLYGPDSATFEAVTGVTGSFERTTGAIRRLTARGVPVVAKTPLLAGNARRIAETRALAESLGATFKWDALVSPMDGGETPPLAHRPTTADLHAVFAGEPSPAPEPHPLDAAPCNAGRGSVAISPRGDVYACVAIKTPAGNVRERPFREIWETGGILETIRAITVGSLRECATCDDRPWCPRCAGMALHEHGSLTAPSLEACRVAAARRAAAEGRPAPAERRARLPVVY
jgi:radical SAM protein with 4Fe4S-binding SPASM domain